jgi:hypothetical protein
MKSSRFATSLLAAVFSLLSLRAYLFGQRMQADTTDLSEPHYQAQLPSPANSYPFRYWDKGYFITYSIEDTSPSRPAAILYDRGGRIAREVTVWFKDARSVAIVDAAVSRSGRVVVAGGTESPAGAIANFIASIGEDGRVGQVIRTTPFTPAYVCAAEDGTVWAYGHDRDENGKRVEGSPRLRQYSFEKGQIRAVLDTSALRSPGWGLSHGQYPGELDLRCTSNKVGLLNGASGEWVEYDIPSNKLKVSKIEPLPPIDQMRITGFALTESGDVFVSLHDRSSQPPRSGLFRLTFEGSGPGKWVPVKDTVGPFLQGAKVGNLLGTDGTELIYTRDFDGTAFWSKYSK